MQVPFFRPDIGADEIDEVVDTLRSGWLTTGPKTQRFEAAFAAAVGAKYALALNSCTAALHVAVDALGLQAGQAVLVPTMTFAATAEIVRYLDAIPILVDCDPVTLNVDLEHAERLLTDIARGHFPPGVSAKTRVVGIIPVHYGGYMVDVDVIRTFADRHGLWVVEDAAHAFPAAWRPSTDARWRRCGENTSDVTCFSFYANKTITTGEGGMAVTDSPTLAERMRTMSLHGLSKEAWGRYSGGGTWDYKIVAPGFKYNLTDVASAIGLHQLARAEEMRAAREVRVGWYNERLGPGSGVTTPTSDGLRLHAWHLYAVQLQLDQLSVTRNDVFEALKAQGITPSVHWRPLHLHPYYQDRFGYGAEACPVATAVFDRLLSLPLFPTMTTEEVDYVVAGVRRACGEPVAAAWPAAR